MLQSKIEGGHVEALVYFFPDGTKAEVEAPATLTVTESGHHLIIDIAGVGVIVPPGWRKVDVYPEFGHGPFGGKVERRVDVQD
jgi:hypothetical protein